MNEKEMKDWQGYNQKLQQAYQEYLNAGLLPASKRERPRNKALENIEDALKWPPFTDYCAEKFASFLGITRYGLDTVTKNCINDINKIANGEMEYDY